MSSTTPSPKKEKSLRSKIRAKDPLYWTPLESEYISLLGKVQRGWSEYLRCFLHYPELREEVATALGQVIDRLEYIEHSLQDRA